MKKIKHIYIPMKIIKDNIWKYHNKNNYIVITTNGFVKKNGECVMGRGIALQAKNKFRGFAKRLGSKIKEQGNKVFIWDEEGLITFPVKHVWWEKADLQLIEKSAIELATYFEEGYQLGADLPKIYMPKPGCSNGKLEWKDVEPIIKCTLNHLVIIVDWNI